MEFNFALSDLKCLREQLKSDIEASSAFLDTAKNSNENSVPVNISIIKFPLTIMERYKYLHHIKSPNSKEEYLDFFSDVYNNHRILRKKRVGNVKNNINIKDGRFQDANSLNELIKELLILSKDSIGKNNISKFLLTVSHNLVDEETKNNIHNIISYFTSEIYRVIELLLSSLEKSLSVAEKLINILEELNTIDIKADYKKYENLVDEFSKTIKKDNRMNIQSVISLNTELRHYVKKYNKKSIISAEESVPVKYGAREDRIRDHEREKQKRELEELKSKLTDDSRIWIDMVFEQINADDKAFIENPSEYLPGFKEDQSALIKDIVLKQLEYKEYDPKIIDAIKNM